MNFFKKIWRRFFPPKYPRAHEIKVPLFDIPPNPTITLSNIKARRFFIVDRNQIKDMDRRLKNEDRDIFNRISTPLTERDLILQRHQAEISRELVYGT